MPPKFTKIEQVAESQLISLFSKVLEDTRARDMVKSLTSVRSGKCRELESFGCADECYTIMRDEFHEYCSYLLETEGSIARHMWDQFSVEEHISLIQGTWPER